MDINTLTAKLDSSKVRDRNEALDALTVLIESHRSLSNKELQSLAESLYGIALNDRIAYTKNDSGATRDRLERAVAVLRKLICKDVKNLKFKTVRSCLEFIRTNLFTFNDRICAPSALDLSRLLHELIQVDEHRDHLSRDDWLQTTSTVIRALKKLAVVNTSEKVFVELLGCLRCLTQVPLVMIDDLSINITELLVLYFDNLKKETSATSTAMEIVNQILIHFTTSNVSSGFDIIRSVTKVAAQLNSTNFEALHNQLLIFGVLSSKYISSDIIPLIDDNGESVPFMDDNSKDNFIHWIDKLLLEEFRSTDSVSLPMIDLSSKSLDNSWFHLDTFSMSTQANPKPWMKLVVLNNLLSALFTLDSTTQNEIGQPWKRRKVDNESYAPLLRSCDSMISLLKNMIQSTNSNIQKVGLQLIAFHIETFETDKSSLKISDVMIYENSRLVPWVSLVLSSMVKHGWTVDSDQLHQILRISLQMIKEEENMAVTCEFVTSIMKTPGTIISDTSLNQLIDALVDVSEVYGPATISNESIMFWLAIAKIRRKSNSNDRRTSTCILKWLRAKWSTISLSSGLAYMLGGLLLWLSGNEGRFTKRVRPIDNIFSRFSARVGQLGPLPDIIMSSTLKHVSNASDFDWIPSPFATHWSEYVIVVEMLIHSIDAYDSQSQGSDQALMVGVGISVYQGIYNIPQVNIEAERLKFSITRALENLQSSDTTFAIIQEFSSFDLFNNAGIFVFEHIKMDHLTRENMLVDAPFNTSTTDLDDFGDFSYVRHRSQKKSSSSLNYCDLIFSNTHEQQTLNMIFNLNCGFSVGLDSAMDQSISHLEGLDPDKFTKTFYSLLKLLKGVNYKSVKKVYIGSLLRLCGTKLLGVYPKERSHITFTLVLEFCLIFSETLLTKGDSGLLYDFADIFNWLLDLGKKGSMYGIMPLSAFGCMIFKVLGHENASEIGDIKLLEISSVSILSEKSNIICYDVCYEFSDYLKQQPKSSQLSWLQSYLTLFESPESTSESAATYASCVVKLSSVSYIVLVSIVNKLSSYSQSFHFTRYLENAVHEILRSVGITIGNIPESIMLDLLGMWYDKHGTLVNYPHTILGYETLAEFVRRNKSLIYALSKSRRTQSQETITLVMELSEVEMEDDLVLESMSWLVPLAFTKNGLKSELLNSIADVFGRELIEYQSLPIISRLLQLCDCSLEEEFFKWIPKSNDNALATKLLSRSSPKLYSLMNGISVSDVIHQIQELTSRSHEKMMFWDWKIIYFLARNLIRVLQKQCLFEDDKVLVMRKLKLLFIIGASGFQNGHSKCAATFTKYLQGFLSDETIHDDVSSLLLIVLKSVPDLLTSALYPDSLLQLFDEASRQYDTTGYVNEDLRIFLKKVFSTIDHKDPWRDLFSTYFDILRDVEIHLSPTSLHSSLKYLSQFPSKSMQSCLFRVMALLFSKSPEKSKLDYGFDINKDVAQLLLKSNYSDFGKNVSAFVGRYLGRYYLETGDALVKVENDFERDSEYFLHDKCSSLRAILDLLLDIQNSTYDLDEVVAIESIFGTLLHSVSKDQAAFEPLVDMTSHVMDSVKRVVPLDPFLFKVLNPYVLTAPSLKELLGSTGTINDCQLWCETFTLSILNELLTEFPILESIKHYVSSFGKVSFKLMNLLWLLYVYTTGSTGASFLNKFIMQSLKGAESHQLEKPKLRIIVHLFYLVEVAARDDKTFSALFKKFVRSEDIISMCVGSIAIGCHKFALLLTEKLVMTGEEGETFKRVTELSSMLREIFGGLSDPDLLYGIPTDASLRSAIELFGVDDDVSLKRLMFASADFDAMMSFQSSNSSKDNLIFVLKQNGLQGLAGIVNEQSDSTSQLGNSYDWSWKLQEWDIPSPDIPETEGEVLYSLLKSLMNAEPSTTGQLCEQMISLVLEKTEDQTILLKSLAAIISVEEINMMDTCNLKENVEHFLKASENWFRVVSFDHFENILLVRRAAFGNIQNRIGSKESDLAVAFEAMRYGYYARLHNEKQKSVNSTLFLSHLVENVTERVLKSFLSKLSLLDTASTLWSQGETIIPIKQLENCLKMKVFEQKSQFPLHVVPLSDSHMNAYLVKWNYEARQRRFEDIMTSYLEPGLNAIESVSTETEKAEVFHIIATYCFKEAQATTTEELSKKHDFLTSKVTELNDLKSTIQNKRIPDRERKDAKRFYSRMILEYNSDKESYEALLNKRQKSAAISLECLLKGLSISDTYDSEDVDKFCGLWLELSTEENVNQVVNKFIRYVPEYKFISWINQLVSRLSNDSNSFQRILSHVIGDICLKHPWHSLTYLVSLRVHKMYEHSKADRTIWSRVLAADSLWNKLAAANPDYSERILRSLDLLTEESIRLATQKVAGSSRNICLENVKYGDFWLNKIHTLDIPLPTLNDIPLSLDGNYESVPRIAKVHPILSISASGISLPKIMKVDLNDGTTHKILLKGSSDDLRQDAIMQQVFSKVNSILQNEKETRKRNLKIRTYKVVPLGPQAGLIEFVADSIPLSDILRKYHEKDSITFDDARMRMKDVQQKSTRERVATYLKIAKKTPPNFRQFFIDTFLNVDDWYSSRQVYTRGLITTSMVGHILGLGDRHLNNILIDKKTGEPIHIDFGVAFDQGKLLPVPEKVPFRLTRDMVDGLGCTGYEGSFRKGSEHVFRVLRANSDKIIGILNVLRYDPLYSWAISPVRKKRLQNDETSMKDKVAGNIEIEGSDAGRALRGVDEKLAAHGLSIEATVHELITEATDVNNLAVIYLGWAPFY
jgi:ataxia telangiectasia mutated family protein